MNLAELQSKIAKHAWEDPAFEAEFMANPKATFEKYTGQPLPQSLTIRAHYNTPTELHFVLPKRADESGELSDDDLDRVAGGEIVGALIVTMAISPTLSVATTVAATTNEGW